MGGVRTALLIARRELGAYFSTWSGYAILAGYLVTSGLLFTAFAVGDEPKASQAVLADFFYYSSGMAIVAAVIWYSGRTPTAFPRRSAGSSMPASALT